MFVLSLLFYVCDCVEVCGNVCCVAAVVKDSGFNLGVLKDVVCLCKGCDGCCVFCVYCDARSWRYSCIGSMSVSSSKYCMVVACVYPVAVINAAFCMTCSLCWSRMQEATIWKRHTSDPFSRLPYI